MSRDGLRPISLQIANIVIVVSVLVVNFLSTAIPLGAGSNAQLVAKYFSGLFFLPANYVFSIWGIIYTLLILFCIYQALPAQRDNKVAAQIGWLFVINGVLNIIWLFAFQYEQWWLSCIPMVGILITLMMIYVRIRQVPAKPIDRWLIYLPFSIYLGWISVATIANFASAMYITGANSLPVEQQALWAAVMIGVASAVGAVMLFRYSDVPFALVLVWAFVGIIARHGGVQTVATAAGVASAIVAVILLVRMVMVRGRVFKMA
jgi:hypothetical protein